MRQDPVRPCHVYSAVQINVVKSCVNYNRTHATFDHVYLDSRVSKHASFKQCIDLPLRLWQLEPIERPRDPRGWRAARRALERHRRTRLQGLVDEAVAQHRGGVCKDKEDISDAYDLGIGESLNLVN